MNELLEAYLAYYKRQNLMDPLYGLMKEVWSPETAHPDTRNNWQPESPEVGQNAVTCYFLAKHLIGGSIAELRLHDESTHYVNWVPNREGVPQRDYCKSPAQSAIKGVISSFTVDEFLAHTRFKEKNLEARARKMCENFMSALLGHAPQAS